MTLRPEELKKINNPYFCGPSCPTYRADARVCKQIFNHLFMSNQETTT